MKNAKCKLESEQAAIIIQRSDIGEIGGFRGLIVISEEVTR